MRFEFVCLDCFVVSDVFLSELLSEDLGVESSLTKFGQLFATNSGGQRLLVLQMVSGTSVDDLEVLMVQDIDQVAKFPRTKVFEEKKSVGVADRKERSLVRTLHCRYCEDVCLKTFRGLLHVMFSKI